MYRFAQLFCLTAMTTILFAMGNTADAQQVVTTYYPPQATVTYLPVQRGLFGQRTSFRPVVAYAPPTTVTRYAPAPVVMVGDPVPFAASTSTTYYTPVTPVTTTFYAPAPVTTYYVSPAYYVAPAPVIVERVNYYVSP